MQNLALSLDRRSFDVTVCYLKQRGQVGELLERAGVDMIGILNSERADYFTFRKLLRVLRERRIDVVHTHTTHGLVDACLCKLFMWKLRVVHTFHFGNYPHTRPRIIMMERLFSRFANRLVAVGQAQKRQLQALFGFADERVGVILNGVTMPTGHGDPEFKQCHGAEGTLVIGTIATLIEQKGLPDLMRVARRVVDAGFNVTFVIVGEGQLRPQLEALRHELGLDERVKLPGWITNAAEVALPQFDVFFQPSLWEAMSVVILEAMATARPIVATRVGETPQILEDGVDGLLVQPRDIDGMTAALTRVLSDATFRAGLGAAARRKVDGRFTVEHMTRAYERVYKGTA